MKVILLQHVKKLGSAGDVVEVSDGHARNFLFPQRLAERATDDLVVHAQQARERLIVRAEKDLHKVEKLAARIDGKEITMPTRTSHHGTLFAALHERDVVKAIEKQLNITLEPSCLKLEHTLKEVGEYRVVVHFDHGLEAGVTIHIVAGASTG